nr:hypothetical protein [Tanacetum cinerariifolium]
KDYAENVKNQSKTRQYQHKIGSQQQRPDQRAWLLIDHPPLIKGPLGLRESSAKRKTSEHEIYTRGELSSSHAMDESIQSGSGTQEQLEEFDAWTNDQGTYDDEVKNINIILIRCRVILKNQRAWESKKEDLTLKILKNPTLVFHSCVRNLKIPPMSLVNQDFSYLRNGNSETRKDVPSLHKIYAFPFLEDDLKELNPRWVKKTIKRPSPTIASTSVEGQNKDSSTSEDVTSPNPPKPFVKFVKPKDSQPKSKSKEQETPKKSQVKYAEQYRHLNKKPKVPTVNRNNPPVSRKFSTGRRIFPTISRKFPTASRKFTTGSTKNHTADMGRKGKAGSSQNNIEDKGEGSKGRQLGLKIIHIRDLHSDLLVTDHIGALAVPRTTLMTKVIGTVAALGT